jgi:3',5'-cyclic AMP phosphodiesterase CpdA
MKLYAISDLHVGFDANRALWETLHPHPDDWILLGGDLGETEAHLRTVVELAVARFARVLWIPGNHELWTLPSERHGLRGEARYLRFVEVCRELGAVTPEDEYPIWRGPGGPCAIAPLFLLYDYTFRPDDVPAEEAVAWARASGVACADEILLHPDPYPSREAWCHARCAATRARLDALPPELPTVLANHFPLRRDLAWLPAVPRFSIWCGTRATERWHLDYRARVVVSGHLHIPSTRWIGEVRFEEVSLGYPRQRRAQPPGAWPTAGDGAARAASIEPYLREILPGPPRAAAEPERP